MDFNGQTAIIAGAARGIGYATAQRLSSSGATIAILHRDGIATAAASSLTAIGRKSFAGEMDVPTSAKLFRSTLRWNT
jgi:NAD(P)-dependent dehydrogenase (short-subunit alcohol dehydrogenase family)